MGGASVVYRGVVNIMPLSVFLKDLEPTAPSPPNSGWKLSGRSVWCAAANLDPVSHRRLVVVNMKRHRETSIVLII